MQRLNFWKLLIIFIHYMIPLLIILLHYNERLIPSFSKRWICYLIVTVYTTATTYITGTERIIEYETVQKKRDEDILGTELLGTKSVWKMKLELIILRSLDWVKVLSNCMASFNSTISYFTNDTRCKWYSNWIQQSVCPHLPHIYLLKKFVLAR